MIHNRPKLEKYFFQGFLGAFLPQVQGVPVNPHVQRVQNMYGKEGQGVFKAELRAAEVDPRFEICREPIAVSIFKDTLPIFIRSLGNEQNMDSNMVTPGSIRFQAIGPKIKKCQFFVTPNLRCKKSRNEGQLRPPVTRP